jgi:hypothetical protein
MNMIVDLLPETVEIDGEEYRINTDFRISIMFELLMQDDELEDSEKTMQALRLYYPIIPKNKSQAVEKIIWFYRCGKESNQNEVDTGGSMQKQIYSFDYDDGYIYEAFLQEYGIDLQDIEDFHWWKFRSLFKGLSNDTEFVKIMGYRSMNITSKMSKEQKQFYKKMQSIHALPVSHKEKEADKLLAEALVNGEDITGLL